MRKASQSLHHIFVAVDDDSGTLAATVRIFARTAVLNNNPGVSVGGMGEVCTLPAYRKRGLATALLRMALVQMESDGTTVSALHAAAAAAAIYNRLGWNPVPMPIYQCRVAPNQLTGTPHSHSAVAKPIDFEDDAAWQAVVKRCCPLQEEFVAGPAGQLCHAHPSYRESARGH